MNTQSASSIQAGQNATINQAQASGQSVAVNAGRDARVSYTSFSLITIHRSEDSSQAAISKPASPAPSNPTQPRAHPVGDVVQSRVCVKGSCKVSCGKKSQNKKANDWIAGKAVLLKPGKPDESIVCVEELRQTHKTGYSVDGYDMLARPANKKATDEANKDNQPLPAYEPFGRDSFGRYFLAQGMSGDARGQIFVLRAIPPQQPSHKDPGQWAKMLDRFRRAQETLGETVFTKTWDPLKDLHIVPWNDLKYHEKGNFYYTVSQYVPVFSIKQLLNKHKLNVLKSPLFTISKIVELLRCLAVCIGQFHAAGIVHRNLTTGNVLYRLKESDIVLSDYWFCKYEKTSSPSQASLDAYHEGDLPWDGFAQSEKDGLTETGKALGTPSYMPPEQIRNARNVGLSADSWPFGVIAWELLTGKNPFDKEDDRIKTWQYVVNEYTDPNQLKPILPKDTPEKLVALLKACLQKIPAQRPGMEQIRKVLNEILG